VKFEIIPAHQLSLAEQATVFTAAFAGYVAGSFELDAGRLAGFMSAHGVDLCYSRFARDEAGELVSFGYINRTGNVSRLAGMGTVPAARRSGAASAVLSSLLKEAAMRGDSAMMLEVIEQNPAGMKLYQSHGFRIVDHLVGWRRTGDKVTDQSNDLHEISIFEAMHLTTHLDYPVLPWQISPHAAVKVVSSRSFCSQRCAVVTGDPDTAPIRVHAFFGSNGTNWESLRELVTMLLARFPSSEFYAPPIFPEGFGNDIFQPLNFRKEELTQFLMRKDFAENSE
jgi:ribosomal protein S18 acetylase RimI-like enzyme